MFQQDSNLSLASPVTLAPGGSITFTYSASTGRFSNSSVSSSPAPAAASISAAAGTPQSATVSSAFAVTLQALVKDNNGNPFSGATVTFAAPASGPSASFSSGPTATAVTNSSGVATAPILTANAQAGSYTVTATVAGVTTAAAFALTNTAAPVTSGGSLTGSGNSATTLVNLTTQGTADWVHWGDSSLNRKSGVQAQISNYAEIGNGQLSTYSNDPRPITWSDGTPTSSSNSNQDGIWVGGLSQGSPLRLPRIHYSNVSSVCGWLV